MTTTHHHTELRWQTFSPWQQLLMIGSEVGRARVCEDRKDREAKYRCLERALELIDFSIADDRWQNHRLRELLILRELVSDHYSDAKEYRAPLEELESYFLPFGALR